MRIGLDMDSVIYDFSSSLASFLEHRGLGVIEHTVWDVWEDYGITHDEWLDYFQDGVECGWLYSKGAPIHNAVVTIQELANQGHTIHIVTHREGARAASDTVKWLERHGVPFHSLTFSGDKSVVDADVFFDDKIENVQEVLYQNGHGVLFDQPWNQDYELTSHIDRVLDWDELADYVALLEEHGY